MILEFLKGELNSKRFNGSLDNIINDLGLDSSIIFNGNINNKKENLDRLNLEVIQIMDYLKIFPKLANGNI